MNDIKQVPYEDFETVKKKADEYISRIFLGISQLERYGRGLKLVVFMSADVLNEIARGSDVVKYRNDTPTKRILTVGGYEIRYVAEMNVLSVGFDLIERGGEG